MFERGAEVKADSRARLQVAARRGACSEAAVCILLSVMPEH